MTNAAFKEVDDVMGIVEQMWAPTTMKSRRPALDQAVGEPLPAETEDNFVARASSSISDLLSQFLAGDGKA